MSRRTWYRRRGTSPKPAIPPLKSVGTNGTSPKPAIFLSAEHTLVPPERKQGASEGALGAKHMAHRHRPPWSSKGASFSQGGGSRRVKRHVACATMACCRRTCGKRRQNDRGRVFQGDSTVALLGRMPRARITGSCSLSICRRSISWREPLRHSMLGLEWTGLDPNLNEATV